MKANSFGVLTDLKIKIEHLLRPVNDSLDSGCREVLQIIYILVESYEKKAETTLKTYLDTIIYREISHLTRIVDEIDSKSEVNDDIFQNLHERAGVRIKEDACSDGLYNVSLVDDEEEDDHGDVSSEVIGVREVYEQLKNMIMGSKQVTSLVGMPGIGKTTLANKLFNDPTVVESFDNRVRIRLGKRYRGKSIPRRMLEEIDPDGLQMLPEGDDEAVREQLKASFKSKRFLIVLDDVWDRLTLHLLYPAYSYQWEHVKQPFFHPKSRSRVLIVSRMQHVGQSLHPRNRHVMLEMRLLTREESWHLLRQKVFSQGSCPPQLEKAGKKISEKCDGLPLTIVLVARMLTGEEEEKSNPKFWDEVATEKDHQFFTVAYDEMSKVLLPSYTILPPLLQMCFLFIGLFPKKFEVPRSKLINLWISDGFFELNVHITCESGVFECLDELVHNNLIMVYQHNSFSLSTNNVKTCGLHSSLWHLSKKKATETKFALLLSSRNDILGDVIEGHRRLSFHTNVLFAIKDVHKLVEDNCASAARSLFCFGPYHQYQVPLCFRLKLLRELDALTIRFYEFPMEVLQLVQLGYLSLTINGMIPASISQLQCLEFLIVDRHQNIKSSKDASYLPMEIWSLQKLKHLQVMGSDLPDPRGATLTNLRTLSDVNARSCTVAVLKGIYGLRELKIRIEFSPGDDGNPLTCLGIHNASYHLSLFSLKCVIVNTGLVPPVAPFSILSNGKGLTRLSLSGLGYHWKELRNVASLPNLVALKLKNYAFQGSEWEMEENYFKCLRHLVIEDTDLVDWKFGSGAFEDLISLKMKQCYKLKKIHGKFGITPSYVKLVDCNPSCVEEMRKALQIRAVIDVKCSWHDDEKLKK